MITVSTTSEREARAVTAVMRLIPALDYRVYLLGRQVDRRYRGVRVTDIRFAGVPVPAGKP